MRYLRAFELRRVIYAYSCMWLRLDLSSRPRSEVSEVVTMVDGGARVVSGKNTFRYLYKYT